MTLKRACSLLTVKSFSEDERVITGIASTPSPDRMVTSGAGGRGVWQCESRFLWQPDHSPPVGQCTVAPGQRRAGNHGNTGEARTGYAVATGCTGWMRSGRPLRPGWVRGCCPWASVPHEYTFSGRRRTAFSALGKDVRVSAVTVPANAECTIRTIKSYDRPFFCRVRQPETGGEKSHLSAGAAQHSQQLVFHKGKDHNDIGEQIKKFWKTSVQRWQPPERS